jgi:hypothetical protein
VSVSAVLLCAHQNCVLYFFGTLFNVLYFLMGPDLYSGGGGAGGHVTHHSDSSSLSNPSLLLTNGTQLAISAGISAAEHHSRVGFFEGYTWLAFGVIVANSLMGLVITAVYKYADALVKTFATACATATLYLLNMTLFHLPLQGSVLLGVAVVFLSSAIYFQAAGMDQEAKKRVEDAWLELATAEQIAARKAAAATAATPLSFTCWRSGQRHKIFTVLVLAILLILATVAITSAQASGITVGGKPLPQTVVNAVQCPVGSTLVGGACEVQLGPTSESVVVPDATEAAASKTPSGPPPLFPESGPEPPSKTTMPPPGYCAVLYSGIPKAFPIAFRSQLVNLILPSPYECHIFMSVHSNLTEDALPAKWNRGRVLDWAMALSRGVLSDKFPGVDHPIVRADPGLRQLFHTLRYFPSMTRLDGSKVTVYSLIRGFQLTFTEMLRVPEPWDKVLYGPVGNAFTPREREQFLDVINEQRVSKLMQSYEEANLSPKAKKYNWSVLRLKCRFRRCVLRYSSCSLGVLCAVVVHRAFRQRFEVSHQLNLWEQIFEITPLVQALRMQRLGKGPKVELEIKPLNSLEVLLDGRSFLYYDQLYKPRLLAGPRDLYSPSRHPINGLDDTFYFGSGLAMRRTMARAPAWLGPRFNVTTGGAFSAPVGSVEWSLEPKDPKDVVQWIGMDETFVPSCYMPLLESPICQVAPGTEDECTPMCHQTVFHSIPRSHVQANIYVDHLSAEAQEVAQNTQMKLDRSFQSIPLLLGQHVPRDASIDSATSGNDYPPPAEGNDQMHEVEVFVGIALESAKDFRRDAHKLLEYDMLRLYLAEVMKEAKLAPPFTVPTPFTLHSAASSYYYYFRYRFPQLHDAPCSWKSEEQSADESVAERDDTVVGGKRICGSAGP